MRVLFVSTHTDQNTGYAKVANNLLKQMSTFNIELYHFGFQRHPTFRRPKLENVIQYDAQANEDNKQLQGFGFSVINDYIKTVKPDIVMFYNDTLVINQFLKIMFPTEETAKTFKIYVYLDQVYKNTQLADIEKHADKLFTFSQTYWKVNITKLPQYEILHAPEPSVKHIALTTEHKTRYKVDDVEGHIYLNINRNSQRKRLDLTIQAWALHVKEFPKDVLILTTSAKGFYNLQVICAMENIDQKNIRIIDTTEHALSDESINILYNIADFGINTSNGEGFGLSTLEHATLNKPQVVIDIGAYREFLNNDTASLLTPTIKNYLGNPIMGFYDETTTPEKVAEALKEVKTKQKPTVSLSWETIGNTLKEHF
jgi:hypothetical protein